MITSLTLTSVLWVPQKDVVTGNTYHLRVWIVLWKVLSNLTFAQTLWSIYLPHFIDEEIASERLCDLFKVIQYAKRGLSPGLSESKSCALIGDCSPGAQKDFGYFSRKSKRKYLSYSYLVAQRLFFLHHRYLKLQMSLAG